MVLDAEARSKSSSLFGCTLREPARQQRQSHNIIITREKHSARSCAIYPAAHSKQDSYLRHFYSYICFFFAKIAIFADFNIFAK
jgi:hypothetical protein